MISALQYMSLNYFMRDAYLNVCILYEAVYSNRWLVVMECAGDDTEEIIGLCRWSVMIKFILLFSATLLNKLIKYQDIKGCSKKT